MSLDISHILHPIILYDNKLNNINAIPPHKTSVHIYNYTTSSNFYSITLLIQPFDSFQQYIFIPIFNFYFLIEYIITNIATTSSIFIITLAIATLLPL